MTQWIPEPFNLRDGNPFEYSQRTISSISGTEAFETAIRTRDRGSCVVCGLSARRVLDYCHIIPKEEDDTWEEMKNTGFVPRTAKSVEHEARNGIQLCPSHHKLFNAHCYYIRWVPEVGRFVFINHSQSRDLEVYHGKAINVDASHDRLPFHGAFLFHEMRVRGYWPLRRDRAIRLPIPWVGWLSTSDDDGGDDGDGDNGGGRGGHGGRGGRGGRGGHGGRGGRGGRGHGSKNKTSGRLLRSGGPVPASSASGEVFIPTNPFANPALLEALKKSFAEQPNWKAAMKEGTTWEGTADENAAKWRKLNRIEE